LRLGKKVSEVTLKKERCPNDNGLREKREKKKKLRCG